MDRPVPRTFDLHCDLPSALVEAGRDDLSDRPEGHLDLSRAERGGLAAFFAIAFVRDDHPEPYASAQRQLLLTRTLVDRHPDRCLRALRAGDLGRCLEDDRLGLFSGLENGRCLEGRLEALDELYALGARSIGLVWNGDNELARGCAAGPGGLRFFGKQVVRRAEELGMLIDTAHLNEQGFFDVVDRTSGPLYNSHANARALRDHPRNLTDVQLRAIGETGGVVGLNFYPPFLVDEGEAHLEDILAHLEHALEVAGPEAVAIGSDFDGIPRSVAELPDASAYPVLYDFLRARGYAEELIAALAHGNAARVLSRVLGD